MSRKLTNEELAIALIKLKKEFNQLSDTNKCINYAILLEYKTQNKK